MKQPVRGAIRALDSKYYNRKSEATNCIRTPKPFISPSDKSSGDRSGTPEPLSEDTSESSDRKYDELFPPKGVKHGRETPAVKTLVQNIDPENVRPRRAGVILYTVSNEAIFFGCGLDANTHEITDFGGHVMNRIDASAIHGALREFDEETLQILEPIRPQDIKHCPVIYDANNLIIFIHVNINPDIMCHVFNTRYQSVVHGDVNKTREPEVCAITWLSWEEFQLSIRSRGIMFRRVQKFLNKAGDFSYLL